MHLHAQFSQPAVQDEGISQQASLLVSILIRYPEFVSIRYGSANGDLLFSFLVNGICSETEIGEFQHTLYTHLSAYMEFTRRRGFLFHLHVMQHGEHTLVEMIRDVATLSQQELSLILNLTRNTFGSRLIYEIEEPLREEENSLQDEMIDQILEDVRVMGTHRELVGYRESGRVFVFNRSPMEVSE